jgi:hypothetical protein
MWLVQKIGLDAKGEIDRVQWQEANVQTNAWVGHPRVSPLSDVLQEMLTAAVALHFEGGGHALCGPALSRVVLASGQESIETAIDRSGAGRRSVWDLPRL